MANITKLSEGKYLIRVSRGTGARRRYDNKTFYGSLTDARKEARDMETAADRGGITRRSTFLDLKTAWLAAIKGTIQPLTYDNYDGNLRRHTTFLDDLKISAITVDDIQGIYNTLTAATAGSLHATLRPCFKWAVRRNYIAVSPCDNTDRPTIRRKRKAVLTLADVKVFVAKCREVPGGLMFEFALETGMRPEEYLAVRWSDLADGDITVEQIVQYNRKGGGFYFGPPKTPQSRRRLPISPSLLAALRQHRRLQNEHRLKLKGTWYDLNLVFPNIVGNPHTLTNVTHRIFQPILELCGFDDRKLSPYSLRHTMATLMLANGTPVKIVSERLGHASIALTLDTYAQVIPNMQNAATDIMDGIMRKAR